MSTPGGDSFVNLSCMQPTKGVIFVLVCFFGGREEAATERSHALNPKPQSNKAGVVDAHAPRCLLYVI